MPIRGSPNGAHPPIIPVHRLVAISRNGWSRSIGMPGRNQSELVVAITRCAQTGSEALPHVGISRASHTRTPVGTAIIERQRIQKRAAAHRHQHHNRPARDLRFKFNLTPSLAHLLLMMTYRMFRTIE